MIPPDDRVLTPLAFCDQCEHLTCLTLALAKLSLNVNQPSIRNVFSIVVHGQADRLACRHHNLGLCDFGKLLNFLEPPFSQL